MQVLVWNWWDAHGFMPGSRSSREHWVRRFFFAVGPISTLGLVGDSGRTVRSLSAASKPHIYPTHDAVTPSIQEEGAEHIFRVHEFRFLLGKICVAHSVDHSFTLFLCCALSIVVEIPPASPRRYSKYRRSSSHMSPQ